MISTHISRASAGVLLAGGLALLFASDDLLPRLIPGFPPSGAWLGQLLAAAWLAVAALNWFSRSMLLGGIYGRSVVMANVVLYFVAAMALLRVVTRSGAPSGVVLLLVPSALFAVAYGWLLYRGPFERDVEMHRRAQRA